MTPSRGVDDAERRFARRLTRILDESTAALPPATLERLASARKAALRVQRFEPARAPEWAPVLSGPRLGNDGSRFGFARVGLVVSAFVLVGACLTGLYQIEQERRIEELADVDAAVLNDDVPISDYADHGFNAFLKQNP